MDPTQQAARQRLARAGELEAGVELERRGYRILARNYRCRGGEADLVAEEGETLVFVEVKTRSQLRYGLPREAVGWSKQQRLGRAAEQYCAVNEVDERPIRFDVVEVVILRDEVATVEVIRDAFIPEM
jgi:putative endonuclease